MKADVLGTIYTINFVNDMKDGYDGLTDYRTKIIKITDDKSHNIPVILRHELMHAFFFEAGLMHSYANDEVLVDFIALQYEKIRELFENARIDYENTDKRAD